MHMEKVLSNHSKETKTNWLAISIFNNLIIKIWIQIRFCQLKRDHCQMINQMYNNLWRKSNHQFLLIKSNKISTAILQEFMIAAPSTLEHKDALKWLTNIKATEMFQPFSYEHFQIKM